ncbi:signal transduction protein [Achromatium sp. WMS2]|nr:signal transduction protein [Achromatium sp. WMS2]
MFVKDIMTREVKTVRPDTKLIEVASLMCLYRYSGLPVVEDGKLVGVVSEKDVLNRLFPSLGEMTDGVASLDLDRLMGQYKEVLGLKVRDVMTMNPLTVSPDIHVLRAATTMNRHKFRRIPVAEGDTLVGMLSMGDVHKGIFHANIADRLP